MHIHAHLEICLYGNDGGEHAGHIAAINLRFLEISIMYWLRKLIRWCFDMLVSRQIVCMYSLILIWTLSKCKRIIHFPMLDSNQWSGSRIEYGSLLGLTPQVALARTQNTGKQKWIKWTQINKSTLTTQAINVHKWPILDSKSWVRETSAISNTLQMW